MDDLSFSYIPDEWGILLPMRHSRKKNQNEATDADLELLRRLREELIEFNGQPISYKEVLAPRYLEVVDHVTSNWLVVALHRLWRSGHVGKFAARLHTQSRRPEYISWYIWPDMKFEKLDRKSPTFHYDDETYIEYETEEEPSRWRGYHEQHSRR